MTQGKLSEIVHVTPTHISNIETGNARVSLTTLVDIANALSTSADALLCDSVLHAKETFCNEINLLLSDCDDYEIRFLTSVLANALDAFRKSNELKQKNRSV